MSIEEQIRHELRGASMPADLVPAGDLAEIVLRRLRRQRQRRAMLAAAVAVVLAGAVPLVALRGEEADPGGAGLRVGVPPTATGPGVGPVPTATGPGAGLEPTDTGPGAGPAGPMIFPTPGGGRQAIHVYQVEPFRAYLLDPASGRYHDVPFAVTLSPNGDRVAVSDGERIGVAERAALFRDGAAAVRWTPLPPGNGPLWSPDGTALLLTAIDKGNGTLRFSAHRFDVATGRLTRTPIDLDLLGGAVGWADDSRRYLALVVGERSADTVTPGELRYVEPDGRLGDRIDVRGGLERGASSYSPSRRLLVTDASGIMSAAPVTSPIIEVATGRVVAEVPAGSRPIGWYDEETLVVLTPAWGGQQRLELLTVATGAVRKRIDLAGLPGATSIEIGPTTGFSATAARFGF